MHPHRRVVQLLAVAILALAGCKKPATPVAEAPGETQPVSTTTPDPAVLALEKELDQGWGPANRQVWYERSQGSRLMPLSWLLALEDKDGKPFFTEETVKRWGYLPHVNRQGRALPIGFTEDVTPDADLPQPVLTWRKVPTDADRVWVGMNCSACHTAQMTYQGKTLTVDGGPALSDFEGFTGELRAALDATEKDDARFARFADRVLGEKPLEPWNTGFQGAVDKAKALVTRNDSDDKDNRTRLRAALGQVAARERELARLNASTGQSDFGRLDAFGHIFNKVAYLTTAPNQQVNPADAPVSYPFLWNVPQHDRVQWNGIAPKREIQGQDVGALVRNTGEVVGVFADIKIAIGEIGYPSSIDVPGLAALEQQLIVLKPPAWPASVFGWNEIKDASGAVTADHDKLVADGKKLFGDPKTGKGRCFMCHQPLPDRTDLTTPIAAQMALFNPRTVVKGNVHKNGGTDIWMACNAYTRQANTGLMKGVPTSLVGRIGDRADLSELTKIAVIGALFKKVPHYIDPLGANLDLKKPPAPGLPTIATAVLGPGQHGGATDPETRCMTATDPTLGYKGRPLNGIWATAPYLHNGSVRTLYQLLLPPAQREASFEVGNREFDPKEVGYVSSTAANHSTLTTTARGSSNAGHDYGNANLSDYDRWALIEYMKTL